MDSLKCQTVMSSSQSRQQQTAWCCNRIPIVTLCLTVLAILVQFTLGLAEACDYSRSHILAGETWRLLTGHLTHWNVDHLLWDALMFLVLATIVERQSRIALIRLLLTSGAIISAVLWICHSGFEQYRGLSGIDSALFTYCAALMIQDAGRQRQPVLVGILVALTLGFAAKIAWELSTGTTFFVDSTAAGFTPLPTVHAAGGVSGILEWFVIGDGSRRGSAEAFPSMARRFQIDDES